ncbi:hypothetical protein PV396_24565 [Streptomyces sp. ME02-8801-2C]|uniref:hypothetical protein n=1 Tax=Streptomyces sp. ME02-8801-2C TaxID=3028680 RepID=UPI0029B624E2|nr:hypothetical protein [Streptomyces sp. ME02-8801-2C]MDX3455076.1 hypothetical protein [Streptomyces sp. ME02-8801-2C]
MSTPDPAMAELARARQALSACLYKGIGLTGARVHERVAQLIDDHQTAVKDAHAHQLAEEIRRASRQYGEHTEMAMRTAANLIDPEPTRGAPAATSRSGYPTLPEAHQ